MHAYLQVFFFLKKMVFEFRISFYRQFFFSNEKLKKKRVYLFKRRRIFPPEK
jgi:hypothetical protein